MSLKRLSIRNFASKIFYYWFYMLQKVMRMKAVGHLCVVQEGGSRDKRSICVCCKKEGVGTGEAFVYGAERRDVRRNRFWVGGYGVVRLWAKKNGAPPSPNLC